MNICKKVCIVHAQVTRWLVSHGAAITSLSLPSYIARRHCALAPAGFLAQLPQLEHVKAHHSSPMTFQGGPEVSVSLVRQLQFLPKLKSLCLDMLPSGVHMCSHLFNRDVQAQLANKVVAAADDT